MSTTRPVTSSWSPASWMLASSHSTQASDPSRTGVPMAPGCQPTPRNLSPPDTAKVRHRASWCSPRMFTQNAPALAIRGQLVDDLAGASATSGGSSDSDVKAWQVKPTGWPSSIAVTTVTPVAKCPRASRKWAASMPAAPVPRRSDVSSEMLTGRAPPLRSRVPEVQGGALLGGRDVADPAGVLEPPCPAHQLLDVAIGVGGVVVEEHQAFGPRLGRHPDRVGVGGVAPVGLVPELVVGVLGVVDDDVGPLAELEHPLGHGAAVQRRLMVGHVGQGLPVGLDPEPQRVAGVEHRA